MACRFEVTLPISDAGGLIAARDALDGIDKLEDQLTVFRETSEVSGINRRAAGGAIEVEKGLFNLLRLCKQLHLDTEGAFDITAGPLTKCWGFFRREGRVPSSGELEEALRLVGSDKVELNSGNHTIRFSTSGVEINFGSIGKGYALDRVGERMRREGVRNALLSGGSSSVLAIGGGHNNEGWPVGVRDPHSRERRIAALRLRDAAMATSGISEQFFDSEGKRYGHIIDPRTGMPSEGIASVSVVAQSAAIADGLATAFFVGGREMAERYCATHPEVLVLMIENDLKRPVVLGANYHCGVEIID
jgi:thiamine biosynthesis lipoprotein